MVVRRTVQGQVCIYWMEDFQIPKEHTNHSHFSFKSVRKERWFKFSKQVDSHNLPNNHKWTYIELGELISFNLDLQLKKYRKEHKLFMSSYLLDVMCASREYPSLGWRWDPTFHKSMYIEKCYGKTNIKRIMNGFVMDYFPHFTKFCLVKKHYVYLPKGKI